MPDAVVMIDESQRIVVFNSAACEMFELEVADVIGEPLEMLLPSGTGEHHTHLVDDFAASETTQRPMSDHRTLMGRRRDGEEFPVAISIGKIDLDGRRLFNAVIRDVTDDRRHEESLLATARHFHALVQRASGGTVITDASGRLLYASPCAERITGAPEGGLMGTVVTDHLHPDDYEAATPLLKSMLANPGMSVRYEARVMNVARGWVWVDHTVTNLLDDADVGGVVVNFREISERKAADAQRAAVADLGLRALRGCPLDQLFHTAAELAVDLLDADSAAILEQVDSDSEELVVRACVGWPQDSVGHPIPATSGSVTSRILAQDAATVVADYESELPFPAKERLDAAGVRSSVGVVIAGRDRPWGVFGVLSAHPDRFTPTAADFVQAIGNVLASAIERNHADETLSYQALHDPLTGLPNRGLLVDRIQLGIAGTRRSRDTTLVVQFLDIDDFKRVNDTLGHDVGDELLRHVARRLQAVVREEDTVARFGGDEFVVVTCLDQRLESPLAFAQRLVTEFREPFYIHRRELFVTASVGIAISTHHGCNAETLLRDADAAMYEAKSQGRNRYAIFDRNVRAQLLKRLATETELRSALDRDELRVYYQPVIDSSTGRTVGFEALVRWAHPQRGLVPPDEFIPIAEDTGLILPIGRWVLRTACEELARCQRDFDRPDLAMSVNLSARQLSDPDFVATLQDVLASTGVAPQKVFLEITESMAVEGLSAAAGTLDAITELNVGFAIDAFGTGYSSLSYLKKLPITSIKIDRSFITHLCDDKADRAIVAAVTELAHRLGISAIAEGVETAEQLAAVRTLGCTLIQGHHYAPALPPADLDAWLSHRTAGAAGTDESAVGLD